MFARLPYRTPLRKHLFTCDASALYRKSISIYMYFSKFSSFIKSCHRDEDKLEVAKKLRDSSITQTFRLVIGLLLSTSTQASPRIVAFIGKRLEYYELETHFFNYWTGCSNLSWMATYNNTVLLMYCFRSQILHFTIWSIWYASRYFSIFTYDGNVKVSHLGNPTDCMSCFIYWTAFRGTPAWRVHTKSFNFGKFRYNLVLRSTVEPNVVPNYYRLWRSCIWVLFRVLFYFTFFFSKLSWKMTDLNHAQLTQ